MNEKSYLEVVVKAPTATPERFESPLNRDISTHNTNHDVSPTAQNVAEVGHGEPGNPVRKEQFQSLIKAARKRRGSSPRRNEAVNSTQLIDYNDENEEQGVPRYLFNEIFESKEFCIEAATKSRDNGHANFRDLVLLSNVSASNNSESSSRHSRSKPTMHGAALKIHAVVKLSRIKKIKRRAKWATKKLVVFILSNGGLVAIVCLYAIIGAFLFQALEKDSELQEKKNLLGSRQIFLDKIWNVTIDTNVLHYDNWTEGVAEVLKELEIETFKKCEAGWDGSEGDTEKPTKWTFAGSLLFAITVITTIGYGESVPETKVGQVVCILYALVGIPMTLLCLANIGAFLAKVYRFTWKHLSKAWRTITFSPNPRLDRRSVDRTQVPITMSITTMVAYVLLGAYIFSSWEQDWTFLDGSYFCFITLSTIGFGDYVPGQGAGSVFSTNERQVTCILYLVIGLALLAMAFQLITENITHRLGRYASMLGLSSKQIDKEMYGSDDEIEHGGENNRSKESDDEEENGYIGHRIMNKEVHYHDDNENGYTGNRMKKEKY